MRLFRNCIFSALLIVFHLPEGEASQSLFSKTIKKETLLELTSEKTPFGGGIWDVIFSGLKTDGSSVGVYATDAYAYEIFSPLLDPIIEAYHGTRISGKHPEEFFGDNLLETFPDLDPEEKYIKSVRIRCARSVPEFPFTLKMGKEELLRLEDRIIQGLSRISDPELKGSYLSLVNMDRDLQVSLVSRGLLFKDSDDFLESSGSFDFWPLGRGVFLNQAENFYVWCGEEDHIRIACMQKGGKVGETLERLKRGVREVTRVCGPFSRSDRLGWLSTCPSNIGSSIRASVHISLPILGKSANFFKVCEFFKLQVRGSSGEGSSVEGGVFDISNKIRFGVSEFESVSKMYFGLQNLIEIEKEMEMGGVPRILLDNSLM